MWKLKNIKWWLQISIFIVRFSSSILSIALRHSAKWKSASSHLSLFLCSAPKWKRFRTEQKYLVKLKTYKSLKSCYAEPQEMSVESRDSCWAFDACRRWDETFQTPEKLHCVCLLWEFSFSFTFGGLRRGDLFVVGVWNEFNFKVK